MAVYIFFADGFEESEAIIPSDFLVRAGFDVKHVAVNDKNADYGSDAEGRGILRVQSAHAVEIVAPYTVYDVEIEDAECLILPGGMPGAQNLSQNIPLIELIRKQLHRNALVAAICAAPIQVLWTHGLLENRSYTSYPTAYSEEKHHKQGKWVNAPVVIDENLITSQGVGTAINFAHAIISTLQNTDAADKLLRQTISSI